jgi:hypothetical protein
MNNALKVLERAVSDAGHWLWWTKNDSIFQVEFGWVMLLMQSPEAGAAPSNTIALSFLGPRCVIAIQRGTKRQELPDDWFAMLGRDEIKPLHVSDEDFTLTDVDKLRAMYECGKRRQVIFGKEDDLDRIRADESFMAFWAGNAGLLVVAKGMEVLSHKGRIEFDLIEQMHTDWWNYWREYWARTDSDNPMPEDSLCEITIPAGD